MLIAYALQGEAFPEITKRMDVVKEILAEEELSFAKTLDRGEKLFEQCLAKAKADGTTIIDGKSAFRLYDTFGFPIDLTRLMAAERGYAIDEATFEKEQQLAKELSRAKKGAKAGDAVKLDIHALGELEKKLQLPKTDDSFKYQKGDITATVKAIFTNKVFVNELNDKEAPSTHIFGLLLDKTNFYAEQGGQEADIGSITNDANNTAFEVEDVQVYGGYVLHTGFLKYGNLKVGDQVLCSYDEVSGSQVFDDH